MKKVLLLNPPSPTGDKIIKDQYCSFTSKAGYYWVPIDLLVLSGDLSKNFDVKVIDSIIEKHSFDETVKLISEWKPDHIVLLSSILTHESDRKLVTTLRETMTFGTTFIGDVFYFSTKEMIQFPEVDSIIYEYPCPELTEYIASGKATCNIVYKNAGTPVFLPHRKHTEIIYETPAHHLFNLKLYSVPFMQDDLCTSVLTNFGCKYTCNYCPADSVAFRERKISDIMTELSLLKNRGISNIWIRDFTFGLNKQRTREFLQEISKLEIRWFCLSRSEILDKDLLQEMSRAGCYLVMIGVDSAADETMKKINRRQNLPELRNKIAMANDSGMHVLVHMILGFPGDSAGNMLKTIHFLSSTKASFLSINFFSPRAGSAYFKEKSIHELSPVDLDSNYAEEGKLKTLKYYALVMFYFNPLRMFVILSKIRSRKQLMTMTKTGLRMFFPVSNQ